jgi:F0F1-type ATP synthase epsilon subunit
MADEQNNNTGEKGETADAKDSIADGFFHCKVYSPYKTYFDGNVRSISAENDTGPFDILAGHHNFLTLLRPCEIRILGIEHAPEDREELIKISRAIMQATAKEVVVFLDI